MAGVMRLDISPPVHGWIAVRLIAPGVDLDYVASFTPRDSIGDLVRAADGLVVGLPEQVVTWNTEPIEYEFRFTTVDGRTKFEVYRFLDHRRQGPGMLLSVVGEDALTVARCVWRGLRRLQGIVSENEFAMAWGHPFPVTKVKQLGEQLRKSATGE